MRPLTTVTLIAALLSCAVSWAAPLSLEPPTSETTEATTAADSVAVVWVFAQLRLTDEQVVRLADVLDQYVQAKKTADKTEDEALLAIHDALASKVTALKTGQEIPKETRAQIADRLTQVVQSRNQLRRQETNVITTFATLLGPGQLLLIAWDQGGAQSAEVRAIVAAARQQSNQAMDAVTRLLWPQVSDLLIMGAQLYRDRRIQYFNDMLGLAGSGSLSRSERREVQQIQEQLVQVFDGWRARIAQEFEGPPPEAALREIAPQVTMDVLQAMGYMPGPNEGPQPIISQQNLERLLLRPETAELLKIRLGFIQAQGGPGGAIGVPPGGPGPGPGPGRGPGGGLGRSSQM